jgi:hypothetical protein
MRGGTQKNTHNNALTKPFFHYINITSSPHKNLQKTLKMAVLSKNQFLKIDTPSNAPRHLPPAPRPAKAPLARPEESVECLRFFSQNRVYWPYATAPPTTCHPFTS